MVGPVTLEVDLDTILTSGCWHHLGCAYDAATGIAIFYLDGVAVGSASTAPGTAILWGDPSPWRFGCNLLNPWLFDNMDGWQSDIRIADLARPPEWFAQVWAARAALYDPDEPAP